MITQQQNKHVKQSPPPKAFSGGIYARIKEPKKNLGFDRFIPGLPHLKNKKQETKGIVLLCCFAFSLLTVFFVLIPGISTFFGQIIFSKSDGNYSALLKALDFPLSFRLLFSSCIISLVLYLIRENHIDLKKQFCNLEKDRQPTLFAGSISGAYLANISFLVIVFAYVLLFSFIPPKKQKTLDIKIDVLQTANNPYQKRPPKKAPADAKLVDRQNAINSGKFTKDKPPIPGNSAPKTTKGRRSQKSRKSSSSKPSQNSSPYKRQSQNKQQNKQKAAPKRFFPKMRGSSSGKPSNKKTPLPKFTPKASEKPILTSSNSSYSVPAQPIGGFQSSSASSSSSYSAPVIPSSAGSYRTGDGFANTNPNNNPNGPVTVAARKEVNYSAYMADIERRITQAWKMIDRVEDNKVIVLFRVAKNGSLITSSLRTISSTNSEAEASARQAIFDASPGFRPLPPGAPSSIPIEFTFTNNLQDISSSVSSSY